jgi:hypothetical protein
MREKTARGWQTLVGIVWVTLGVIPLLMLPFGGSHVVWREVLPETPGAWGWIAPTAVVVVGLVLLVGLDRKRADG